MKYIYLFTISFCLLACTETSLFVANLPQYFADYTLYENISYGKRQRQNLDIYIPDEDDFSVPEKGYPIIVFFYGGAYSKGNADQYKFIADSFAKSGYVVVIPNYRLYPDVRFPTFVEDGAAAITWINKNIHRYDGDKQNMHVVGHSAGAHIGALLAADISYGAQDKIKSFTGLAGPYNFTPKAKKFREIFGPAENYPLMRVSSYIDGSEPPMLLITGGQDKIVGRFNALELEESVVSKSGQLRVIHYTNLNHVDLVKYMSVFLKNRSTLFEDILGFLKENTDN